VGGTVTTGWHSDPFGVHEARYFSADGQPTKLVRDQGFESYDEPPSGPDEVAAAMARMAAMPEPPSGWAPRDPYSYHRADERGPRRPSFGTMLAVGGLVLAVGAAAVIVAQSMTHPPKPAGTAAGAAGLSDVAFVTQAATRTLQQHTVNLVVSATTAAGGTAVALHGTGAFDLGGKAGTMNLTENFKTYKLTIQEILLNGQVYLGMSLNGRSFMPAGKSWIAEQAAAQGSGITGLTGGADPTGELTSLSNQGITVSDLGTKDIGGVPCTGYTVTPPSGSTAITVWINPQHLVSELSLNLTGDFSIGVATVGGASASPTPMSSTDSLSIDLTMDFTYSAARVHVTAPPAASTMSLNDWLNQIEQSPALKQLEPSPGAS
jgi:hypothetical protein